MDDLTHIAATVQFLMKAIVDDPAQLIVSVCEGDGKSVIFDVRSSPRDVGRLIGMQGRTARAFRTILTSVSGKLDRRITLNIMSPHENRSDDGNYIVNLSP